MKIKKIFLLILATVIFACSSEETIELQDENANITVEVDTQNTEINGPGRWSGCSIPFNFPPVAPLGTPGNLIFITYSDDPLDYPGGVVDIECTRFEYFNRFCLLKMVQIQNQDPYKDLWIKVSNPPVGCLPFPKDDVDVASNTDPRVCVGTACDD